MTFVIHTALATLAVVAQLAVPAAAQDMPSIDYNGSLDHARTTGRLVRQAQQRDQRMIRAGRPTPGQIAACRDKEQHSQVHGADHPKVRKLYQLCRRVGL